MPALSLSIVVVVAAIITVVQVVVAVVVVVAHDNVTSRVGKFAVCASLSCLLLLFIVNEGAEEGMWQHYGNN